MINTEVFLFFENKWHSLYIKDTIPFPLTYNIADIQDITKRNNSFSKTVEFPPSKINDEVFGFIFDIASVSNFDINKKVKCTIVVDTIPILKEAYLQLKKVKTTDNKHFSYETVIFGDGDNFIQDMGSRLMTDIDFSELNHVYSTANIINSWTASWSNGYYYGLSDLGKQYTINNVGASTSGVPFLDMYPNPSVKYMFLKLLSSNGWSVESNWIENDETFNNTYLLSGQKPLPPATYSLYNTFIAGLTNSIVITTPGRTWQYNGLGTQSLLFGTNIYGFNNNMNYDTGGQGTLNSPETTANFLLRQGTASSPFKWDDDFTDPNFDYGNNFNITSHKYRVGPNPNPMNFTVSFDITIPSDVYSHIQNAEVFLLVNWYRSSWPSPNTVYLPTGPLTYAKGGEIPFTGFSFPLDGPIGLIAPVPSFPGYAQAFQNVKLTPGRWIRSSSMSFGDPSQAQFFNRYAPIEGEDIWASLSIFSARRGFSTATASIGPGFTLTINRVDLTNNNENTYFKNTIRTDLTPNSSIIGGASMIPNNMKQVDFFTSIVKMFNLYIEADKFISKRLHIEPRNDYYSGGITKNWTNKIDINKNIEFDIIAEGQNKQILLTYKLDKDALNTQFNTTSKKIYGEYKYTLDNEFSKGETKIEPIFASTPVANIPGTDIIVPKIYKDSNFNAPLDSFIPRILQRNTNGLVALEVNDYWKISHTTPFISLTFSSYPYLGHYNHPFNPTSDLNFGEYQPYYDVDSNNLTNNNLFQKYYKQQLDEMTNKESRIMSLYVKLTSQDINEFNFSDIIQIDNIASGSTNYFRVNKIEYDPTQIGPFKVELLKLIYKGVAANPIDNGDRINPIQLGLISGRFNYNIDPSNFVVGNNNDIFDDVTGSSISGDSNIIISSSNVDIRGIGNTVSNTHNSLLLGDNNNIINTGTYSQEGLYIFGNDNNIVGVTNSFIIGSGITSTQSNSVIISTDNFEIVSSIPNIPGVSGWKTKTGSFEISLGSGGGTLIEIGDAVGALTYVEYSLVVLDPNTNTTSFFKGIATTILDGAGSNISSSIYQSVNGVGHLFPYDNFSFADAFVVALPQSPSILSISAVPDPATSVNPVLPFKCSYIINYNIIK